MNKKNQRKKNKLDDFFCLETFMPECELFLHGKQISMAGACAGNKLIFCKKESGTNRFSINKKSAGGESSRIAVQL